YRHCGPHDQAAQRRHVTLARLTPGRGWAAALVPRLLLDTDRTPAGMLGQAFLGLAEACPVFSPCSTASWKCETGLGIPSTPATDRLGRRTRSPRCYLSTSAYLGRPS